MSDILERPERIFVGRPEYRAWSDTRLLNIDAEYIRADLCEAHVQEIERLRDLLERARPAVQNETSLIRRMGDRDERLEAETLLVKIDEALETK